MCGAVIGCLGLLNGFSGSKNATREYDVESCVCLVWYLCLMVSRVAKMLPAYVWVCDCFFEWDCSMVSRVVKLLPAYLWGCDCIC